MYQNLKVIYEDGVLKPLQKLDLREHQQVAIFILPDDTEAAQLVKSQKKALSKLCGIGESGCSDLGQHHDKYLYPEK